MTKTSRAKNERMLPLYEAKMFHQFDHRWATYFPESGFREVTLTEKQDPGFAVLPRYWVREDVVRDALPDGLVSMMGFRDITNGTNERTVIAAKIPPVAVGHTAPLIVSKRPAQGTACLLAMLDSFALDYVARQKVGGTHLTYNYLQQFPVLHPSVFDDKCAWQEEVTVGRWVLERVSELLCTTEDMVAYQSELGFDGRPFHWKPERRALLRAELDAAFFHLYGLDRTETDYIMETFPIVKRHDEAAHGEYRTKRLILEVYDALAESTRTGNAYHTPLDPPPGSKT